MASFTNHARIRQSQRNIPDDSVNEVIKSGIQVDCKGGAIYYNKKTKVVLSHDNNTVITVSTNHRNTRFNLSERSKKKEQSLFNQVSVHNNDHAMCELAELYISGELGEKNVKGALKLYEKAAKMGNSHAMVKLFELYETGIMGMPDTDKANLWLKKAADKNNSFALALHGQRLLKKYLENYPKDSNTFKPSAPKKEILSYLQKAVDKGSSRATWQIGNIYEVGLLGEINMDKALEYYIKAAKTGSEASLQSLHELTLVSKFSSKDLEDILDHVSSYNCETSVGNAFLLGVHQLNGDLGKNQARGLKMIELVACKEFDEAMLNLVHCYRDGIGCDVDLRLAQYWYHKIHNTYKKSAESGNIQSLWQLGKLFLNGDIGNINLEKAESCFKKVTEKSSNPLYFYELGILYFKGQLGNKPVNTGNEYIAQAFKKWQLQAAQGISSAKINMIDKYLGNYLYKDAMYWLFQFPKKNVNSQLYLAKIYLNETSPKKNVNLGLEILENVILECGVPVREAFEFVNLKKDNETLIWLQNKVDQNENHATKNSNLYMFKKEICFILGIFYESGESGKINKTLASKYYNMLLLDFNENIVGYKLLMFYIQNHLPKLYHNTLKDWVLQLPILFETEKIYFNEFMKISLLLSKLYLKKNGIVKHDIAESAKWLILHSYLLTSDKTVSEDELKNLSPLDSIQKQQIVTKLSLLMTENFKLFNLKIYKIMCRILGDIYYDNKFVNQNVDKAIYWYTESSNLNNSKASLALAKIHQFDKKDFDESIKWYILSVQQGNVKALKILTDIVEKQNLVNLVSFLNKYKHQSTVHESELADIMPYKNLKSYPKTAKEMFELGKSYLDLKDKEDTHVQNASFWFRNAKIRGNIYAVKELMMMYKSGILGNNLIQIADDLQIDIIIMCYAKLSSLLKAYLDTKIKKKNYIVLEVKDLCVVLKTSFFNFPDKLKQLLQTVIDQAESINKKILTDLVLELQLLVLELKANISNYKKLPKFLLENVTSFKEAGLSVEINSSIAEENLTFQKQNLISSKPQSKENSDIAKVLAEILKNNL